MSRKVYSILAGLNIALAILMSGCGPSADLSLKFTPEQTTTYKAVSDAIKNFRFEQPNANKLREEQTKTSVEMVFTQTIENVDAEGNATAKITIDELKVQVVNKNDNRFKFDSSNPDSMKSPLAKLLGQSYTIQISPAGEVKILETQKAVAVIPPGYERKLATSLLNEENVIERHQIQALPKDAAELSVGESWNAVVPSPPGLLAPKMYKKVYTLSNIKTSQGSEIGTIEMTAAEDAEPAAGTSAGGMGMFAKMFDNEDDYTGSMTIDLSSGTVLNSEETLISTYLAQEMPEKGNPEKGPDTLTMRFTHRVKLEKLD